MCVSNQSIRNESMLDEFGQVLALVQEQMRDLSSIERQRCTMVARATAAEGTVEVTVNARRTVVETVVDEPTWRTSSSPNWAGTSPARRGPRSVSSGADRCRSSVFSPRSCVPRPPTWRR
jgi:hypothetical protein